MLAFMPQSPPLPVHAPTTSSTMSLAILPSAPMAYSQPSTSAPLLQSPSPSKRPKLSLNTSIQPSVFGKGSTSLRLETLSATSPTSRNTFRNGHSSNALRIATSQSQTKPVLPPLSTDVSQTSSDPSHGDSDDSNDSVASSTSTACSSSIGSASPAVPYKLPYNITSILSNSPLPKRRTVAVSFTQSKPMFPPAKRVAFRSPLTEDIKTSKYTLKHSDIESSTSTISTLELTSKEEQTDPEATKDTQQAESKKNVVKIETSSPHIGDKRESSDEEDSDSCPATPVAGRRKRHRQWVWTLGTVKTTQQDSSDELKEGSDNSEDR